MKDTLGNQAQFLVKMEFKSANPDTNKQAQEVVFDQNQVVDQPAKIQVEDQKQQEQSQPSSQKTEAVRQQQQPKPSIKQAEPQTNQAADQVMQNQVQIDLNAIPDEEEGKFEDDV